MANLDVTVDGNLTDKASVSATDRLLVVDDTTDALQDLEVSVLSAYLASLSQTLTNKTLTTPTIASFANATHNHSNAVGGGALVTGYPLVLTISGFSPLDSTTYYWGSPTAALATTTATQRKRFIPVAGTITRADIAAHNYGGTVGSTETSSIYVRLNNTTDTLLSSAVVNNAASTNTNFYNVTGLSVAVAVGDYVEIKWVTPAWVTNPTSVWMEVVLHIS